MFIQKKEMIPTNIPPGVNRPVQIETVKDVQIQGLVSKLSHSLDVFRSIHISGVDTSYSKNDMLYRALFLDLLRTKNRERLLQFNFVKKFLPSANTFCSRAVEELQIYIEGYSIDDVIDILDLSPYTNFFDNLCGDLKMKSAGGENVDLSPDWDEDNRFYRLPECIQYLISALRFQNFPEPEFTDFTRVPQGMPIRLETGEPNYQFFNQWYDNCVKYIDGK